MHGVYAVGREDDYKVILNKIFTSNDEGEVVSVLPIVGMGGVGKTFLAKLVYNSREVREHFDLIIWISVPDEGPLSVMDIFRLILEESTGTKARSKVTIDGIREIIYRGRYFLVLDNVWREDSDLWDGFFYILREFSRPGTKNWCLVTTRSAMVAQVVSQGPAYSLTLLSEDECWRIILDKTCGSDGIVHFEELLPLKSQLVTRCGGLPLAATVIGDSLLSVRKDDWADSVSGILEDGDIAVLIGLRLSYRILPHPIRKCFAFFSVLDEEDDVVDKDLLIELWMAQGFLDQQLAGVQMEETGVAYLNTLVKVSLLQEITEGRVYRMHPFVRDLALSESNFQCVSSKKDLGHLPRTVRHLEIVTSEETVVYTTGSACIFHGSSNYMKQLLEYKYLYSLNLSKVDMTKLPSSVGALVSLRFLNLSNSKITSLPEALCDLYHLQTLRMVDCLHLLGFPKRMGGLVSLRHLHYFNDDGKFQMPMNIGRLASLQTLEFFNVGDAEQCGIEELGYLYNLKGKLAIRNLELVKSAQGAMLSSKPDLVKLDLQWGVNVDRSRRDDTWTLEELEPHKNLQKLVIRHFLGSSFPQWLGEMEMLVKLKLVACGRCQELPALGHLPYLEHVELRDLGRVRYIGNEFYGQDYLIHGSEYLFPALKILTIINLRYLVAWDTVSANVKVFPKLENLTIQDCFELKRIPAVFPNLKYFEVSSCRFVKHISKFKSPLLEIVRLLKCERLLELPAIFQNKFLRWLEIRECPEIRQVNLSCGQEDLQVIISHCKRLRYVECWKTVQNLRGLKVYDCPNLRVLDTDCQITPHLSTLWIHKCPNLLIRGLHLQQNLSELRIGPSSDNQPSLFRNLSNSETLQVLRLYGFPLKEPHLPYGHFTSLTELWLQDYDSMAALPEWIGNLTSLETLGLANCCELQQFPSTMRSLTKLQILDVSECPLLKERCSDPEGSEWSKISHIPNIWIL